MDFGKILDDWEKSKPQRERNNKNKAMDDVIDKWSPRDHDLREKESGDHDVKKANLAKRKELLLLAPEREIDLHGLYADEAVKRVDAFIRKCAHDGVKKVLIIHGKGLHSDNLPVLSKRVVQYIQRCKLAGEYGVAPKEWGGKGAIWVMLRQLAR
jgi:DNA-nicking Smr family endonuclease